MGQPTPMASSGQSPTDPTLAVLRNRLWRAALALTRSYQDAEDLTQQTITLVLARKPEFMSHVGYLRTTMFRLWLDEQRSVRRRFRRVAKVALSLNLSKTDNDKVSHDELLERVHEAIDSLPPQQHAAVVLRLIDGLDYGEIASTLDCPIGTIRANLHLARRKIRQLMGEPCDDQAG